MPISEEFLRRDKVAGIVRILNLKDDKVYLFFSPDVVKSYRDVRFALDLGAYKIESLQNDYTTIGLELFSIELEEECTLENSEILLEKKREAYKSKGFSIYL